MSTKPLAAWPKWRDDLIHQLRLKDVPGDRIGDILLEVEEHTSESGETPEEAFGPAKSYAESRSNAIPQTGEDEEDVNLILQILVPGLGGFLLATGVFDLGSGDYAWGSTRPWIMLITGSTLLTWVLIRLPIDLVRDPRTGNALFRERGEMIAIMMSAFLVAAGLMYAAGRLVA
jgi:hypothetical protein